VVAIATLLLALPIGFLVRERLAAFTAYAVVYLWAFVFQSVYLLLEYADGSREAFQPDTFPAAYGVVTGGVLVVGCGLVALGRWLRRQTSSRSSRTGTRASARNGNAAASAKVSG
jgi:hypothetical protein